MVHQVAIWASGNGTNAENIIKFFAEKAEVANIAIVICNNAEARVISRARKLGIATLVVNKRLIDETEVADRIMGSLGVDFVVLSGYMLKMPERLVNKYTNRMVNIHPALLPRFGGKGMYGDHVHEAVIAAGEKKSGITIHYVNSHYDEGATIFQAECEVMPDDTPETLARRVHALEYEYYPKVIEGVLRGMR